MKRKSVESAAASIAGGEKKKKELKRQGHYMPQFWTKGFAGNGGGVFGRRRGEAKAKRVSASHWRRIEPRGTRSKSAARGSGVAASAVRYIRSIPAMMRTVPATIWTVTGSEWTMVPVIAADIGAAVTKIATRAADACSIAYDQSSSTPAPGRAAE